MSWFDWVTLVVAGASAMECVAGRLAALDISRHRLAYLGSYWLAAGVCFLAGSLMAQGLDSHWLDAATWAIAAHLLATLGDWRDGPPLQACKPQPQRQRSGDLVPSGFDDGRR